MTGKQLKCPHCGKTNVVAGYFEGKSRPAEGSAKTTVYCGFCGKTFQPPRSDQQPVEPAGK